MRVIIQLSLGGLMWAACLSESNHGRLLQDIETRVEVSDTEVDDTVDRCAGVVCDDRDPCTRDVCSEGVCEYRRAQGCVTECAASNYITPAEVAVRGWSDMLYVTGTVAIDPSDLSCDDGPDCECVGNAGLSASGITVKLRTEVNGEAWTCASRGCGERAASCQPTHAGVRYRVWGMPLFDWQLESTDANGNVDGMPQPGASGLFVRGFCLETRDTALVGTYAGRVSTGGHEYTFEGRIRHDVAGPEMAISDFECLDCPADMAPPVIRATVPIHTGDGWISLPEVLPVMSEHADDVALYANGNRLVGRYGVSTSSTPEGTIVLERIAP